MYRVALRLVLVIFIWLGGGVLYEKFIMPLGTIHVSWTMLYGFFLGTLATWIPWILTTKEEER